MFSEEKKCFTEYLNYFNWKKIVYENKPGAVYKNGHALPYQAPRKHFEFFLSSGMVPLTKNMKREIYSGRFK